MNTEQVASVGAAAVLVLVVALSAATLQTTVSTDPADAVDLDADYLPLDDGEIADIDRELRESTGEPAESEDDTSEGDTVGERQDPDGSSTAAESGAGDDESESDGPGRLTSPGSPLPRTVPWRLLFALFALLGLVGGGYRYADRLRAAVGTLGREGGREPGRDHAATPAPENGVQRAWIELVERSGVDDPWTKTPQECTRAAVAAGADPDAVRRLRRTFEAVTYGTAVATDERVRAAEETLDRAWRGAS